MPIAVAGYVHLVMRVKMKRMMMDNLFKYTLHNLVGHPLMELCHLIGFNNLAETIHYATLPVSEQNKK
jgi:hypothetical protein